MTKRLEEIKAMRACFPKSIDASMIWWARNINWLITEVEQLRIELEGQHGAYLMAIDDLTTKRGTIAELREALERAECTIMELRHRRGIIR